MLDALLFAGLLTRPPAVTGFSLADLWAFIRYAPAIADTAELRLRREWRDIDAHQKTILSDDLGMGVSASVLELELGFAEFADTVYALRHAYRQRLHLVHTPRRGPGKSPDFLVLDYAGRINFLECKGTQASQRALRSAVADGVQQKRNVGAVQGTTHIQHALSAGVFIPQFHHRSAPLFHVSDPTPDEIVELLKGTSDDALRTGIQLVSLAKQLALAGWVNAAAILSDAWERTPEELRLAVIRDTGRSKTRKEATSGEFERALPLPRGAVTVDGADVQEVVFSARVPDRLATMLLATTNFDALASEVPAGEWRRDDVDFGRRLTAPSGIEFDLELRV
jgi:hypothetical protein